MQLKSGGNNAMTAPLWTPSEGRIERAQINRFIEHVNEHCDADVARDYFALHRWAVAHTEAFWSSVWDFCGVQASV